MSQHTTAFLLTTGLLFAGIPCSAQEPMPVHAPTAVQVHGTIEQIGPFRALRTWGTPHEIGFAHGYLLAAEIAAVYEADFVSTSGSNLKAADAARTMIRAALTIPDDAMEEIEGMFEGIVAANHGKPPQLEQLDRPMTLNDLVIYNSRDALRAFGCSGFTVWGEQAGDAGVITSRNFDFPVPGKIGIDNQMLMVRHGNDQHAVATVTFPGYIGAFTALNEHGVCAFMHDGTGGVQRRPVRRYTPVPLALTEFLAKASPEDAQEKAEETLEDVSPYTFSYMVRIVGPRVGDAPPVRVFRIDPSKQVTENVTSNSFSVTTNHYLTPEGDAVEDAGDWTLERYGKLEAAVQDGMDAGSSWQAMLAVECENQYFPTLHTLVVYPELKKLDLAFGAWEGRVIPAPRSEPTTIDFERLFARPGR